ncbi:MAG: YraN family protein [Bacteroidota bacterium]
MAEHNELGKKGEGLATGLLREKGYRILENNFTYQKAEVDIIAIKDDILVAVEVKTRSTPEFGDPKDFLKPQQIRRLVKAIDYYVNENDLDVEVRFDVVGIIENKMGTSIEHIEDAFFYFD